MHRYIVASRWLYNKKSVGMFKVVGKKNNNQYGFQVSAVSRPRYIFRVQLIYSVQLNTSEESLVLFNDVVSISDTRQSQ